MRLGIIGLPQSGKTTVFNALTRGDQPVTTSGGRFDVHTAIVGVPDARVDRLSALFQPEKITRAKVTYADIAGLDGKKNGGISGPLLNQLTQMDGFLHVVRCFPDSAVPHPAGSVDPERDIAAMDAELLLNDLIAIERKLERLAEERKKNNGRDRGLLERESRLFERLQSELATEKPLRAVAISPEEEKMLSGYGFLTRKPVLIVLNLGDGQAPPVLNYPQPRSGIVPLQGRLEMEIAQLDPAEAEVFLQEFGIVEPGLDRVIRRSYDLLGLLSFFTVGEDEVRAWTIQRGSTAFEAAGAIHSDLQKGFIRADVIHWDDLLALGGLAEARSRGRLRLEGREYSVSDGDIVHIRFNL